MKKIVLVISFFMLIQSDIVQPSWEAFFDKGFTTLRSRCESFISSLSNKQIVVGAAIVGVSLLAWQRYQSYRNRTIGASPRPGGGVLLHTATHARVAEDEGFEWRDVKHVFYNNNGQYAFVLYNSGQGCLFDMQAGRPQPVGECLQGVTQVVWHSNQNYVFVCSQVSNQRVGQVYNCTMQKIGNQIQGVKNIAWNPNFTVYFAQNEENNWVLLGLDGIQLRETISSFVSWSPCGKFFFIKPAGTEELYLCSYEDYEIIENFTKVVDVAWKPSPRSAHAAFTSRAPGFSIIKKEKTWLGFGKDVINGYLYQINSTGYASHAGYKSFQAEKRRSSFNNVISVDWSTLGTECLVINKQRQAYFVYDTGFQRNFVNEHVSKGLWLNDSVCCLFFDDGRVILKKLLMPDQNSEVQLSVDSIQSIQVNKKAEDVDRLFVINSDGCGYILGLDGHIISTYQQCQKATWTPDGQQLIVTHGANKGVFDKDGQRVIEIH